ncbi:hypothetical protein GGR52DRAFT_361778 [Hypoxylon sp. FL1284]|nr:hypothetical protein GGR52DRAFT_361778 [Hypoxylon sp. FL1284]
MSTITRLPKATTHLLGSSLVIITPVTLVKELLDNSIDAKATSVEILISADTVKKIEVRDNGFGIHPSDYDTLGRRSHTSKLRSFDDLKTQSGKTLGFRGEALASVNSLANVTITTRIASEPVAAILQIVPSTGGVSKQHPTSAPVGTTVSVTKLFGRVPVRERMAVKNSAKTIDMIRELLRSYAMARPQLKLSFRVLPSPKQGWSYSPKLGASIREAAIQLFGADIANQCSEMTFEIGGAVNEDSSLKEHNESPQNDSYVFEALIPKPGLDISRMPKHRYLSIDGRPIAARKGTVKKLLDIYSEHLSTALRPISSAAIPKDCFIRLNIRCPPGSYDVNIEPSRDEVLFSNEQTILDGFKGLCEEVYGATSADTTNSRLEPEDSSLPGTTGHLGNQGSVFAEPLVGSGAAGTRKGGLPQQTQSQFTSGEQEVSSQVQDQRTSTTHQGRPDRLQGISQDGSSTVPSSFVPISAPAFSTQTDHSPLRAVDPGNGPPSSRRGQWKVNMSTDYNESCFDNRGKRRHSPTQTTSSSQGELNVDESSASQDVNPWIIAKTNGPKASQATREPISQERPAPLTYELPIRPGPPILRHADAAPRDLDIPSSQRRFHPQDNSHPSPPTLPGGPFRSPVSNPQNTMTSSPMPSPLKPRSRRNYAPWSPPSSVPRAEDRNERLRNHDQSATDGIRQTTLPYKGTKGGHKKRRREDDEDDPQQEYMGNEHQIEEELRQIFTAGKGRRQVSQQKGQCHVPLEDSQEHSHTRTRATQHQAEGSSASGIKEPIQTTLLDDDPRAYLLRRQKSMAEEEKGGRPRKIRRLKSSHLPLENVPAGSEVHSWAMVEAWNVEVLGIYAKQCALYDKYIKRGADDNGLDMSLAEGRELEARLKPMLRT